MGSDEITSIWLDEFKDFDPIKWNEIFAAIGPELLEKHKAEYILYSEVMDNPQLKEKSMPKLKSPKLSEDAMNEFKESLAAVCLTLNEIIVANPESFMLTQMEKLTVKTHNDKYVGMPHVGGEDFKISRAYVGKRNSIIYVFKPAMASEYVEMEMNEAEACKSLSGFSEWFRSNVGSRVENEINAINVARAAALEKEKNAHKAELYADIGFGSWG